MEMKYNHDIQFDLDHLSAYEHVTDLNEKKAELDAVYKQHRELSDIFNRSCAVCNVRMAIHIEHSDNYSTLLFSCRNCDIQYKELKNNI